jgi:GT2 family glycosyltransferase
MRGHRARFRRGFAQVNRRLLQTARERLTKHRRLAAFVEDRVARRPWLQRFAKRLALGGREERYARWILAYDTLSESDVGDMRRGLSPSEPRVLFSLLVPLAGARDAPAKLRASIAAQVFDDLELLLVGEAADDPVSWSTALESARGEFLVLVDRPVLLRPHALLAFARTIERDSNATVIYADEDTIDESGVRSNHWFKPDWSPSLLACQNYLGGFVCLRRSVVESVGARPDEIPGFWGWSLSLRLATEVDPDSVHHLPFVLHHRASEEVQQPDAASRARAMRALASRLSGIQGPVEVEAAGEFSFRSRRVISERQPSVTVIVPSTGDARILDPCIEGLVRRTSYANVEIIVVANGPQIYEAKRRRYLQDVGAHENVRVVFDDATAYNFSRLNNEAVRAAETELVCFLNDDTEVITPEWLAAMVARVSEDGVAAAGAMLYFPNDTIQHAGVILGVGDIAAHAYAGSPRGTPGYHDRALLDQDISCVTAACMLVRRQAFLDVGGFDEALAIAYNDVDLCLRLREAGWRIVWTASAELYHRESASLGRHTLGSSEAEWLAARVIVKGRWSKQLLEDPYYSPNLSLDRFELWEPAFPPRLATRPWAETTVARC